MTSEEPVDERVERNRKISELREPEPSLKAIAHLVANRRYDTEGGCWSIHRHSGQPIERMESYYCEPKNWHADANWPTLLREMPSATIYRARGGGSVVTPNGWFCSWDRYHEHNVGEYGWNDCSEAVCNAWLSWKGVRIDNPPPK